MVVVTAEVWAVATRVAATVAVRVARGQGGQGGRMAGGRMAPSVATQEHQRHTAMQAHDVKATSTRMTDRYP